MTVRDAFIERVRRAAEQGRPYRVHSKPVPEDIGYVGAGGDLVSRFSEELNAVGGQAIVVCDKVEALSVLGNLIAELKPRSALCWQHELLDELDMGGLLGNCGARALSYSQLADMPPERQRAEMLACDVGVTSCDYAIAETGTLVMCARPGHERVASLLPPVHISVVRRSQILADLIDFFRLLRAQNLPSNVTFITGPSKTGDIELQLTTGVHGPGRLVVIVISDDSPSGE